MATPVIMPRQGQSVESCILVEWLVAKGDRVAEGQSLANIETDKAVFEVESPAAGTVLDLFFEAGDDVPVLTNIAALGEPGEDVSDLNPAGGATPAPAQAEAAPVAEAPPTAPVEPTPAPTSTANGSGQSAVSPRARQQAAHAGIDTATLSGTGPGGRIIERDVIGARASRPAISPAAAEALTQGGRQAPLTGSGPGGRVLASDLVDAVATPAAPMAAPAVQATTGEPITTAMTGIRKIIAERMHQSLATTAQLTLNMSFDATALLHFRKRIKANAEALGLPDITLNDMIVYAAGRALMRTPELNAHFLVDRIVQFPDVNMGIAMDTPRGLMVPVLSQVQTRSLSDISRSIKPIVEAAQKGAINPDLLQGGTFTITNMGMLGIESFTPILNAPEVAILGVGGLTLKPVARDGDVVHVQSMNLSLTIDHQATDGAPGARFLKDICKSLENFDISLA